MEALVVGMSELVDPEWAEARSIAEVERFVQAGRVVVVTPLELAGPVAEGDEEAAEVAAASVCAWLGARVFRTRRPDRLRQAVQMTQTIAGRRPPTLTRRGLA
ncbi:hypothetical protein HNP84_003669 [Thermocatellispora tengchongensis]|uniref:Uncharacterized protein n=1 Tax=Thermocatellispora tengchongensis TaxID=1073253 RepID=A0A840P7P7_9ACTN|nr:hypothetical protein [Thermocatellispora tengchongensis]MBB5133943.1 hypothetical protein [Thermocatellispora tengchongensis]